MGGLASSLSLSQQACSSLTGVRDQPFPRTGSPLCPALPAAPFLHCSQGDREKWWDHALLLLNLSKPFYHCPNKSQFLTGPMGPSPSPPSPLPLPLSTGLGPVLWRPQMQSLHLSSWFLGLNAAPKEPHPPSLQNISKNVPSPHNSH